MGYDARVAQLYGRTPAIHWERAGQRKTADID